MPIRHKVPSIFSLSMVDMLCCALGCVILVWLLNARMSQEEIEDSHQQLEELRARIRDDRAESDRLLQSAQAERDRVAGLASQLEKRTRDLESERGRLTGQLTSEQKQARQLALDLASARQRLQALEADMRTTLARLESEKKQVAALDAQLEAEKTRITGLDRLLESEKKRSAGLDQQLESEKKRSAGLDQQLTERAAELRGLRADLSAGQKRYLTEKERADALAETIERRQKELADLNRALTTRMRELELALGREGMLKKDLEKSQAGMTAAEKARAQAEREREVALALANARVASLEKQSARLRQVAENRFAGITLTGKRVVFLVDTSGSMSYVDDRTPAPNKWSEVAATVAQLMRSLPDLEQYQLITFSLAESYPLGERGQWIPYDPQRSPEEVRRKLLAIKPAGGTNMFAGLKATFDYRSKGMDVVYLFSDGLPSVGEGLTPERARTLSEEQRGAILGRYIRDKLKSDWNRSLPTGQPPVRINTIGFYYESPDLGAFLWALARENDGSFVGMSRP